MNPGILVGAGFLLGSLGVKALTSEKAKKTYVNGIVAGMRVKEGVQVVIDEARAQFDDIMAEAAYVKTASEGRVVEEESAANSSVAAASDSQDSLHGDAIAGSDCDSRAEG